MNVHSPIFTTPSTKLGRNPVRLHFVPIITFFILLELFNFRQALGDLALLETLPTLSAKLFELAGKL